MTDLPDDIDVMCVAFHEAGHGLAGRMGGMAVRSMRIERSIWDGRVMCGVTVLDPPKPGAATALWRAYAVMLFAGLIAQVRYLDQVGALTPVVHARVEKGAGGDYEYWLRDRVHCQWSETVARQQAHLFVERHWGRMARIAERLARTYRLTGSAL